MSDFLGRIAARAVGEAPAARPRAPSAFEGLGGELALEVHSEEVVRPAPVQQAPAGQALVVEHPPPVVRRESVVVGSNEPPATSQRSEPPAPVDADPFVPATPVDTAPAAQPPDPPLASAELLGARDVPAPPSIVRPSQSERPLVAVAAVAVATPVVAAIATQTRAQEPPSSESAVVTVDEPPVRVHIGRLEVRANLQQPPPPPGRQRAEARADDLSLADYLRGKRVRA